MDCPVASEYEGGAILRVMGALGLCMMTVGSPGKEKKRVASLIVETKAEIPPQMPVGLTTAIK